MTTPPLAVEALVVRAQRGDRAAFTELAERFLRAAYAIALAIVVRPADAEDVAQDSFVIALERIETCREPSRFAGWLMQIVRSRSLNWLDQRRLRDVPTGEATADDRGAPETPMPELATARERLVAALGALGQTQREVVLLHDLEEWTHGEIAAALGISEVMSRQHLFQARRTMRTMLDREAVQRSKP